MPNLKDYTPETIDAFCKTIADYRDLAKTGDASAWENYGEFWACRICVASGLICEYEDNEHAHCERCPLGPFDDCVGQTHEQLFKALRSGDVDKIKAAAQARLTWIWERCK